MIGVNDLSAVVRHILPEPWRDARVVIDATHEGHALRLWRYPSGIPVLVAKLHFTEADLCDVRNEHAFVDMIRDRIRAAFNGSRWPRFRKFWRAA